jgi:hypothetical protein
LSPLQPTKIRHKLSYFPKTKVRSHYHNRNIESNQYLPAIIKIFPKPEAKQNAQNQIIKLEKKILTTLLKGKAARSSDCRKTHTHTHDYYQGKQLYKKEFKT